MNDTDRAEWINNDEGLYLWWRSSHIGITRFVRENRKEIDQAIEQQLNRWKPRHQ